MPPEAQARAVATQQKRIADANRKETRRQLIRGIGFLLLLLVGFIVLVSHG
jgi:hypothetical protein